MDAFMHTLFPDFSAGYAGMCKTYEIAGLLAGYGISAMQEVHTRSDMLASRGLNSGRHSRHCRRRRRTGPPAYSEPRCAALCAIYRRDRSFPSRCCRVARRGQLSTVCPALGSWHYLQPPLRAISAATASEMGPNCLRPALPPERIADCWLSGGAER